MGKFANELTAPVSNLTHIPIKRPWTGQSEFEALGHEVPNFRREAGNTHLKEMGFTNADQRFTIVQTMAGHIERDNPHMALEDALKQGVDATGCYRLMSVLLCTPQPETKS
jgi:hypothetical protein